jgi:PGF-pre-PGF domain-containing protein
VENELSKILRDVNTTLTLKVLPDTKIIGLPVDYQLVDNTYEWTNAAANNALIHLLMGRLREIEYTPGLSISVSEAPAGQPTPIDLGEELVVSEIVITPKETITDFSVTVTPVDKPPEAPPPPGIARTYFQANVPEPVEKGEIRFRVEKTWMQQNNIGKENIRLLVYDEDQKEWIHLPTEIVDEDDNYLYCSAETTRFGMFATTALPALPTVPTAPVVAVPLYVIVVGVIALIIVLVAIIWRYLWAGGRKLKKQPAGFKW